MHRILWMRWQREVSTAYLSVPQTAKRLSYGETYVRRLVQCGALRGIRLDLADRRARCRAIRADVYAQQARPPAQDSLIRCSAWTRLLGPALPRVGRRSRLTAAIYRRYQRPSAPAMPGPAQAEQRAARRHHGARYTL